MNERRYENFFTVATGHQPFDYQRRLAGGDPGTTCHSQLINVPTGLGKTAAVVLAWLWNRVQLQSPKWPRRIVYCLPMRTLVEQTETEVRTWLQSLVNKAAELGIEAQALENLKWLAGHSPIVLMGGEEAQREWDVHPERPAILIGTQDMLLSRALNRGYGMSRYRWPMHFALLNNDALWILDETQLMGVGVETSAQLDGFRHLDQWAQHGSSPTWWMSATLDEARIATVDHPRPVAGWERVTLGDGERAAAGVRERFEARKPASRAAFILSPATKDDHARELANLIAQKHAAGTLTLVVVNRVSRARKLYEILTRDKKLGLDPARIALIHSRFRPADRARHTELLFGKSDRIVIATQAVEAGVDVSARLLITELAPWSSLVQRFGRCNRRGDLNEAANVIWIDIQPKDDDDDLLLPYGADALKKAREAIIGLADVGPQSLGPIQVPETPVVRPVLRRRDLIDLFDTTPDLCGQDLDISRYIRDGEDSDVEFFWRTFPGESPPPEERPARREELCRVSLGDAAKFLKKNKNCAWQWNALDEAWQKAHHARPGAVYLISTAAGGYDDDLGWTGEPRNQPTPHTPESGEIDAYRKDLQTFARYWLSLPEHTAGVITTINALTRSLSLDNTLATAFHTAALWHDAGKAHPVFQKMLRGGDASRLNTLWAKSGDKAATCERTGFRHELGSALMWLTAGPKEAQDRDLIAYLIAAHHGKVRLSIRALPDEKGNPENPDGLFARGIWHGDKIDPVPELTEQPITLDLQLMQMGESEHGPSWLARTIALRDQIGPFRLAYLESLLRAADMRTSRDEQSAHAETIQES
jgi:CRISPR-associated endonuclease/helicase Cas3